MATSTPKPSPSEDFHEPIAIRKRSHDVFVANCTDCHFEMVSGIIAQDHTDTMQSLDCIRCHRDVGHGPIK